MSYNNISINYKRLKRHYDLNLVKFDEIALYDLAHALRMWLDMEDAVNDYLLGKSPNTKFKSYTVSKQLSRLLKNKKYILAGLPGGVSSYAGNEDLFSTTRDVSKKFTQSLKVKRDINNAIHFASIIYINDVSVPKEDLKILHKGLPDKTLKFSQWLDSEITRISYLSESNELVRKIIPRRIFIERVANILGGSHPKGINEFENKYNEAVKYLMDFSYGGLPTPYFFILKVAKDILDNVTPPK